MLLSCANIPQVNTQVRSTVTTRPASMPADSYNAETCPLMAKLQETYREKLQCIVVVLLRT